MTPREELERDVRRSIILGHYVHAWGMPSERTLSRRGSDVVEVYSFPPRGESHVHRFATVGVSAVPRDDQSLAGWELYLVSPKDMADATPSEVVSFLLDVMAYSLRREVRFAVGQTISETPLMPKSWRPRALLLDEPRGEPAELADFHVGIQHVKLIWLVPIYPEERELIVKQGLDAFDVADSGSDWSLADPRRPSLVS